MPRLHAAILVVCFFLAMVVGTASAQAVPGAALRVEASAGHSGLTDYLVENFPTWREEVHQRTGLVGPTEARCVLVSDVDDAETWLAQQFGSPVDLPESIAGLAFKRLNLIILVLSAYQENTYAEAAQTLRHEYMHLVMGAYETTTRWPRWWEEGVCQWVERSLYLSSPVIQQVRAGTYDLPTLDALETQISPDFPSVVDRGAAYAMAEDAVRHLMSRVNLPAAALQNLADRFARDGDFSAQFQAVFGMSLAEFQTDWRHELRPGFWSMAWYFLNTYWFNLLFGLVPLLLIIAWWRRRRRRYRQESQLDPRDAVDDARQSPDSLPPPEVSRRELAAKRRRERGGEMLYPWEEWEEDDERW